MFLKLNKYRNAGVKEYWVVDPENLQVIVYDLEHDRLADKYSFQDHVPVLLSEGECEVDFRRIYDRIRRYLQEESIDSSLLKNENRTGW